jgi:hypothetical protein
LLEFLIAPYTNPELREQVTRAEVMAGCSCGCPSVALSTDAAPVASEVLRDSPHFVNQDLTSISAWA